jgi:cob(I)alamin adenosyltransferase
MANSLGLVSLRKTLAEVVEELPQEGKRKIAEEAITKILDAIEAGVCPLGDWERRCLAAAITSIRSGRLDQARTMARRALWPEENRRVASIAKLPLRPGMFSVDELKREFKAACTMLRERKPSK